jgi:hypothetical protein
MEGLRSLVTVLGDRRDKLCQNYAEVVADKDVLASPGWLAPLEPALELTGQPLDQAGTVISDRRGLVPGVETAANMAGQFGARLDKLAGDINKRTGAAWDALHRQWVQLVETVLTAPGIKGLEEIESRIDALQRAIAAVPPAPSNLAGVAYSGRRREFDLFARKARPQAAQEPASPVAAPLTVLGLPAAANRDTLLAMTVMATGLAEKTNVHWEFSDGSHSAVFPAPPPGPGGTTELSTRHRFASGSGPASAQLVDGDGRPVAEPWRGDVGSFSIAERLRRALGADDRVVAMVAGVLAVASGMAALYLNAPAWGSAGNYIAALL